MKSNNNALTINLSMFIFLIICSVTVLNDIIIFFSAINYNMSLLIALFIIVIFYIIIKNKLKIENNFSKFDMIPISIYIVLFIILAQHKDDFIDTVTYHLYNQRNPFIDKINFDYLPSSTFFFPLAERMNYIFVKFLGYKYGTFLSFYVIIVLYYQVKRILVLLIPNITNKKLIIYSSIIDYSLAANILIAKFFVDSFSTIVLLEMILICVKNYNIFEKKEFLYYLILLSSFSISIKISNIFLAFTIIAFCIICCVYNFGLKELKKIKFYDYLILLFLFLLPLCIYIYNNYSQTGNPVFPFYNNIFKSIYFKNDVGTDQRLGPKSLLEIIFWPLIICFIPILGDDIYGMVDIIYGIGLIVSICLLFCKKNTIISKMSLLSIILTYTWVIFIFGYTRYGLVIAILYYIITIYVLNSFIDNIVIQSKDEEVKIKETITNFSCLCLILVCITISISQSLAFNIVRISDNMYKNSNVSEKYDNIEQYNINGIWICTKYNAGYIDLIRSSEDPMYNMDIILDDDPMCHVNSGFSDYSKKQFIEKISDKELYTIIPYNYKNYVLKVLKKLGFKITDEIGIYSNEKFLNAYNSLQIVKLEFNTN